MRERADTDEPTWEWDFCVLISAVRSGALVQECDGSIAATASTEPCADLISVVDLANERLRGFDFQNYDGSVGIVLPFDELDEDDLAAIRCDDTIGCGQSVMREPDETAERVLTTP